MNDLHLNLQSGMSGVDGLTTFQPARFNASIWPRANDVESGIDVGRRSTELARGMFTRLF